MSHNLLESGIVYNQKWSGFLCLAEIRLAMGRTDCISCKSAQKYCVWKNSAADRLALRLLHGNFAAWTHLPGSLAGAPGATLHTYCPEDAASDTADEAATFGCPAKGPAAKPKQTRAAG